MAKVELGALLSNISGSIGGTTFRRTRTGFSAGRKSNGYSKNISLKNTSLGYLREVRNMWNLLEYEDKKRWNDKAAAITFPNKFGKEIYLTGRLLFIKANSPLAIIKKTYTDGSLFEKYLAVCSIEEFIVDVTANEAKFYLRYSDVKAYFFISFEIGRKAKNEPVFNRRKVVQRIETNIDIEVNIWSSIVELFPYIKVGDTVRIYVTPCNQYGYQTTPLTLVTVAV
jgi:hypothetical protein